MKEWLGHITLSSESNEPIRVLGCFGTLVWNDTWQLGVAIGGLAPLFVWEVPGSHLGPEIF